MGERIKRVKETAPYAAPAAAGGLAGAFFGFLGIVLTEGFSDLEVTRAGWGWTVFLSTLTGAAITAGIIHKWDKGYSEERVRNAEDRADDAEGRLRRVREVASGR